MGYLSKKRNIRRFWKYPLVILCYALAILAFVAGVFGILAMIGGAGTGCLVFGILMLAAGVGLIILGKKLYAAKRQNKREPDPAEFGRHTR